jgi:hypothetical protein
LIDCQRRPSSEGKLSPRVTDGVQRFRSVAMRLAGCGSSLNIETCWLLCIDGASTERGFTVNTDRRFSSCTHKRLSGSVVDGDEYHFPVAACNVGSRRHILLEQRNNDSRHLYDDLGNGQQSDASNELLLFLVCLHSGFELVEQLGFVCRLDR